MASTTRWIRSTGAGRTSDHSIGAAWVCDAIAVAGRARPAVHSPVVPLRAVAALFLLACGGSPPGKDRPSTTDTGPSTGTTPVTPGVDGLVAQLEAAGFLVQEGDLTFDAASDCCDWKSCLHTNPAGRYGTYALPPAPGEFRGDREPDEHGQTVTWRLRPDEALLYIGPEPPGAHYTSFRTYLDDVADGDRRAIYFGSLGDSLNQLVWETNPDGTLVVASTGHAGTLAAVEAAVDAAGWPVTNLDRIPVDALTLGLDEPADALRMTLRVHGIEDVAAVDAWGESPDVRILRVTPKATESTTDPLPAPPLREPTVHGIPDLSGAVAELREAILAEHAGWATQEAVLNVSIPPTDETCWPGCNRDVSYASTPGVPLLEGERIVVYGVDAVGLGRSAYIALVLYGASNSDAAAVFEPGFTPGTARAFLPDHPDADRLYAWTFARDCTGVAHCSPVPTGCPGVDPLELATVMWRAYLDPDTASFPHPDDIGGRGAIRFAPP